MLLTRSKLALAAVLAGAVVSVGTQAPAWYLSSDPLTLPIDLQAGGAVEIDLYISLNGAAKRSAESVSLDLDLEAVNHAPTSGLLSLYELSSAWSGALPDDAVLVDSLVARGAMFEEPADVQGRLSGRALDAVDQEVHLVVIVGEGDPEIEGDLVIRVSTWTGDEPEDGAQLSLDLL
jgi:hypothetical protein